MPSAEAHGPDRAGAGAGPALPAGDAPRPAGATVSADEKGRLTFRVSVPNRPLLGSKETILLALRIDRSGAGFDVLAGLDGEGQSFLVVLDDLRPREASTFAAAYADGTASFWIDRADLGVRSELEFAVIGAAADDATFAEAPGGGTWTYRLAD